MGSSTAQPAEPKKEEVKEEPAGQTVAKKPRAFVEETDIFDFSGMTKVVNNAPLVIDKVDKSQPPEQALKPTTKASSTSKTSAPKMT